jgi:hypothetical protein
MVFQAGCPVEAFEGANEHNNTNKDGSNPDWNVELENFHRTAFNNLNASNNPGIPDLSSPLSIDAGDCPPGPLDLGPYSAAKDGPRPYWPRYAMMAT